MTFSIWCIGKTDEKYLVQGIDKYAKRLSHYTKIEFEYFKDVKPALTPIETLKREADIVLNRLKHDDFLIILDERGKTLGSVDFSKYIESLGLRSIKRVVLLVGGAFGHHPDIRERANDSISLSKMTFSHQMVRLFLVEQLYRAFTIIRNEKYHNE